MSKFEYIGGLIGFFILACYLWFGFKFNRDLDENTMYTKAVIIDNAIIQRGNYYIKYNYYIKGKEYSSRGIYYPDKQIVNIGDTCKIRYDSTYPSNSRLVYIDKFHVEIIRLQFPLELYLDSIQGK